MANQSPTQYILTILVNGYRRKVGKVYNEEELLKAIDTVPSEYQPEYELLSPPKEEHYTRTVRPSWNHKRELEREWKKVGLRRCECGSVSVYRHYNSGVVKCMECGVVGPRTKRMFLPLKTEWVIVEEGKGV